MFYSGLRADFFASFFQILHKNWTLLLSKPCLNMHISCFLITRFIQLISFFMEFFCLNFSISWYEDVLNTFFENMNQSDNEQPVQTSSKLSGSCCWNPEKQLRFNWFNYEIFMISNWALYNQQCLNKSVFTI